MKLEDQVVSYELAVKLKELGIRKLANFGWHEGDLIQKPQGDIQLIRDGVVHTYTATELLEILPVSIPKEVRRLCLRKAHNNEYYVNYFGLIGFRDKNPANALSNQLIHLIENNLWSPEK